jgi:hypothetical protein
VLSAAAAAAAGGLTACKKDLLATGGRFYKQPHPSTAAAGGTRHLQLPQQIILATSVQQQHLATLLYTAVTAQHGSPQTANCRGSHSSCGPVLRHHC